MRVGEHCNNETLQKIGKNQVGRFSFKKTVEINLTYTISVFTIATNVITDELPTPIPFANSGQAPIYLSAVRPLEHCPHEISNFTVVLYDLDELF